MSERWTDHKILESYEPSRLLSFPADASIVNSVFYENIPGKSPVLEVGSGDGALSRYLKPINRSNLIQLDGSHAYNVRNKDYRARPRVVTADMLSLPFGADTFEAVVGLNSLDTVTDLEKSIAEIKRVLKPDGKLVHFMNLPAQPEIFMKRKTKDDIPFPFFSTGELGIVSIGMQFVKKEELARLIEESEPLAQEALKDYANNYIDRYGLYYQESIDILRVMGEYIENHKAAHTQYKSITEEFQKDIGECLNQQGFGIIFNGSRRTIEPVLRARIPKSAREALNTRGDNIILSYPEGHLTASMKELTGVNPDMVYIIGEMNVTIAHKK